MIAPEHWQIDNNCIRREYRFHDFHDTMAFVNAVAWIAHQSNHHPDLEIGYNYCRIRFSTHDAGNTVTEKDINAAKQVNALLP